MLHIQTGFHGADLFNGWDESDMEGVNARESADKYGSLLHLRIKAEFPDAVIVVNWDHDASGALAYNQKTRVEDEDHDRSIDEAIVDQIAADLYEDDAVWLVA
jgi:hypothetical protein